MKKLPNFTWIFWIVLAFVPGFLGQLATGPAIATWYVTLTKPVIAPPNWVFAPVWTLLYLSMGMAAALVWQKGGSNPRVRTALAVYVGQLFLNGLWSFLFFGWHLLFIAFIEIIVLWLFILWSLVKFYNISKPAGLLLVPYLLWVTFASLLNFSFWWLNR